jgi:hypothetical protein
MKPRMTDSAIIALVNALAELPASERLFNPYAPSGGEASAIRRANLICYLNALARLKPRALLLAEAPGYRGCAVTGIPITSERIMKERIEKWGLFGDGYRPTSDHPDGIAEMTATIVWNALIEHTDVPPLLWNTVPLHPHKAGQPGTNRTPTVPEIRMGQPFIERVMDLFDIQTVLGVGRKAQRTLRELEIEHAELRHPSQGGKADFIAGLRAALG